MNQLSNWSIELILPAAFRQTVHLYRCVRKKLKHHLQTNANEPKKTNRPKNNNCSVYQHTFC